MRERKHLGGVSKGHRPLSRAIEGREHVDEKGNQPQVRRIALGDEVAHARGEEGPGHVGEGEEEQGATAEGVDGPDCGPGEDEVDEAEAEGGDEGFGFSGPGEAEDGRGVEGDDWTSVGY